MQVKTVQYGAGERGRAAAIHGELVCGPETLTRGRTRREPRRSRRRHPRPSARRRLSPRPLAGVVEGQGAAVVGRQLGRPAASIRAAISRASCRRRRSRNGSRCTASSTGRISTPITAASCSCNSSTISSTARTTAGTNSRRCCCRSAIPARSSSLAARTNGRSPAPSGRSSISIRPTAASADARPPARPTLVRGDGRRPHLPLRSR